MATKKTAIAVPEELLAEVDEAARERGESRSRFITRVLRAAVRARTDREITRRLDALYGDPQRAEEDGRAAEALGADWDDERW